MATSSKAKKKTVRLASGRKRARHGCKRKSPTTHPMLKSTTGAPIAPKAKCD